MKIESATQKITVSTIALTGRLDAMNASELRTVLQSHLDEGTNRLIVDLSDVEFVDSAGLAALVSGMKKARQDNGDVRLVAPQNEDAQRVFVLTKFDQVFSISPDLETARLHW